MEHCDTAILPVNSSAITDRAVRSVKWSALMEMVSRTASPIITVILARLLTPADFGVVATAMIAISFAQMFWDAGLGKALIQTKESPHEAAHVVFWTNLVLGLLIYSLLFVTAPPIAGFFRSPASGPVLRVLGLQIVIASLSSVQQALFVRELDFRRLFRIKLSTAFVPGFFSIPLALCGIGVWALVVGTLVGQALNLYLLWHYSAWRPKWRYDLPLASSMFGFGSWVLLEAFGSWLIMWGDSLIVGRYLGLHDLGVYRVGWSLVAVTFGGVLNPVLPVVYPAFSRLQDNMPALRDSFHKINRTIIALALPMGVGLLLVAPEMTALFFGSRWRGLGFVLSILSFREAISWLVGINGDVYKAIGRPDVSTKLTYAALMYVMPTYWFAAPHGLQVFACARMMVTVVYLGVQLYVLSRVLNISPFYIWVQGRGVFIATCVMGAVLWTGKAIHHVCVISLPLTLLLFIIIGIVAYAASLCVLDQRLMRQTYQLFKRVAVS